MRNPLTYVLQFVLLVALQVLILNNVELAGYLNPYLYIVFLLILPSSINKNILLLIGFALGLSIDLFENSGGLHTSASLLVAFIRPTLFRFIAGPASTEIERMNVQTLGLGRFLILAGITVFVHHFWLFLIESFSLKDLLQVLKRTLFSGVFTLLLIYLAQLLVYRKEA